MLDYLNSLPAWVLRAVWSVFTVVAIYLLGQFLTLSVCRRLSAWASKTTWKWDELVVDALRRGLPFWTLLFGLYVAIGFWAPAPQTVDTLGRVLHVLFWLSLTLVGAGLAGRLVSSYARQFQDALPATSLTENLARLVIVILGGLMILNSLGISIAPLLTALGVGGLAVALAFQDTLANLFAGFYLTMARQVRIGDYVKLESGQEGYVEDIGWRATTIRMLPNNMVVVPNKKLGEAILTNYYLPSRDLAVLVEVGVDYASDLSKVERVTSEVGREVMRGVAGGVSDFEPFIRYHTFGEYSIQFTAILRGKEFVDQYLIKHEFIKRLHERYRTEGIVIPFPTQTVYRKDEE